MTDIDFCPLNPALIELKDTLRLAASTFNESTTDQRRAAVLWYLGAIGDYLRAVLGPQEGAALTPLNQLVYALVDLERGKTAKLLRAAKVKGRPRDSAGQEGFRAFGAVAMDLLMEGMVPRKQAARTRGREGDRGGVG